MATRLIVFPFESPYIPLYERTIDETNFWVIQEMVVFFYGKVFLPSYALCFSRFCPPQCRLVGNPCRQCLGSNPGSRAQPVRHKEDCARLNLIPRPLLLRASRNLTYPNCGLTELFTSTQSTAASQDVLRRSLEKIA